jgi:hypothetical protein
VTPQSQFMVLAPLAAGREASLRTLLETMNAEPGIANPDNDLLPFAAFEQLHFARLVLLDDPSLGDIEAYGLPRPTPPLCLAFLGDCDGPTSAFFSVLVRHASAGLRRIFAHCKDFDERADLLPWMLARDCPPAARYVNWIGRSVRQIREESALQRALAARVDRSPLTSAADAQQRRLTLIDYVESEIRSGRLQLTPTARTPLRWWIANLLHAIAIPLVGLLALPFLIVASPVLIAQLRWRETHDPEICPRPSAEALGQLQRLEDRDVSNQYTAIGSLKPGLFRRGLLTVLLLLVDYACRHVFKRGYLARVQTIHFARWVFLDDKTRILFTSNYDGSHQAYMDDFINKVGWGLNLLFSNGVGWPSTDWLILRGSRREHLFKYYQRRHQIPTQVWYKAYPGLALTNLLHNQRIRAGLRRVPMSDSEASQWLTLL